MPGSLAAAAPTTVFPATLSTAFSHSREYAVLDNEYRDGASQRKLQSQTSRLRWRQTKRLTPSQKSALETFYNARAGAHQPFYFYDPYETSPRFTSDPTGVETVGRFTVRFDCPWGQSVGIARVNIDQIEFVEIA